MTDPSGAPARAAFCVLIALACASCSTAPSSMPSGAPRYEIAANWPKPLPERWVLGGLGGVCVDARDHVFILNRQDVADGDMNGGRMAPSIIEFDSAGNVANSWGDARLIDPRLHSCHEDAEGNIWIAAAPSGMVQKYSHDGARLLLQIGTKGKLDTSDGAEKGTPLNSSAATYTSPSSIYVDRGNGDVYVSDGESPKQNKRIVVTDKNGNFLRQWQLPHMESVHCLSMSRAGEVYVCNRTGSRIEVYDKMGKLLRNFAVPWTPVTPPKDGKLRETGGSADTAQKWIYVMNQNNAQVEVFERESGRHLASFGRPGTFVGEFNQAHGIAVDSKGNVYIAENRGRRVMKFVMQP